MKKLYIITILLISNAIAANASGIKRYSQFTGDFNGDGHTDIIIADRTNYKDAFGFLKIFYGSANGIDSLAAFTFNCTKDNFLESPYSVMALPDINGDGADEIGLLLTNLSGKNSGRSHQDILIFYGSKLGISQSPIVLKLETDDKDKKSIRDFYGFDYNGDGFGDILAISTERIYKTFEPGWTDNNRKLILFAGGPGGISNKAAQIKDADGFAFKGAGDFNNDGFADMIAGEPVSKGTKWQFTQYMGNKNNAASPKPFLTYDLPKAFSFDRMYSMIVRDFNGDKYDDFLTLYEDPTKFISFKKPDSTVYTVSFYTGSETGLTDSAVYSWQMKTASGTIMNITTCGDINKDGFGDFVIQVYTPKPKSPTIMLMQANILWGGKNEPQFDSSETFNNLFHSLYLVNYGFAGIATIGDVNNDGCDDLLLGVETIFYGGPYNNYKTVQLKFLE